MRTYYRGSDALVTDDHFVWHSSSTQFFAIRELKKIVLVAGPPRRSGHGPALGAGAGLLILAGAGWLSLGAAAGFSMVAAAALITLVLVSLANQRTTQTWQVRATYRGEVVTLYSSSDLRVFNQVVRALRRTLENKSAAPSRPDMAAA